MQTYLWRLHSTVNGVLRRLQHSLCVLRLFFIIIFTIVALTFFLFDQEDGSTVGDAALRRLLADFPKSLKSTVDMPSVAIQAGAPWHLTLQHEAVVELALCVEL